MSDRPHTDDSGLIDAYLDDQLEPEARANFEKHMAQNAELAVEVRAQRLIDESLRRRFSAADPDRVLDAALRTASAGGRKTSKPWPWWGRVAAAAALVAFAAAVAWYLPLNVGPNGASPPDYGPRGPQQTIATHYHRTIDAGFVAAWACPPEEFFNTFKSQFGRGLVLGQAPPHVRPLGLSYLNCLSPWTISFLARVHEQPVMVFVDTLDEDTETLMSDAHDPDLKLFKRRAGKLFLYELTPLDEPNVLPILSAEAQSDEATERRSDGGTER